MLHRLFDELIDGFGTEQSPPIAFDLSAEAMCCTVHSQWRLRRAKYRPYIAPPAEA
jgi:hypothetical protein